MNGPDSAEHQMARHGPYVLQFFGGGTGQPQYTTAAQIVSPGSSFNFYTYCYITCATSAGVANTSPIAIGAPGREVIVLPGSTTPYEFKGLSPNTLSFKAVSGPTSTDIVTFVFIQGTP